MDFDGKEMLEKILALTEENNKILRKMRRAVLWGRIVSFLYWAVIIGLSIGAYVYVQPYLESMLKVFGTGKEAIANIENLSKNLNNLPNFTKLTQ
jgi:uncharacterized membrane protein